MRSFARDTTALKALLVLASRQRRTLAAGFGVMSLAAIALSACASTADSSVLRPQDKKLPEGVTFDPTNLMTDSSFVDTTPADARH